ncbi:hypothetical protein [Endozoicomonas atrinae]|uniref:hypothetical protein n=1 Tax=Endozoicomonas atrinae TaxID=1333660 RepID=UPI003B006DA6
MSKYQTQQTKKLKTHPYEQFKGIDTTRALISLESGEGQLLTELNNAYPDAQGQIVRDSCAKPRASSNRVIRHIRHLNNDEVFWIEEYGNALRFQTDTNSLDEDIYPINATVSSVIFNQKLHIFSKGLPTYSYDGVRWERNQSSDLNVIRPGFAASVQRRLFVAGGTSQPTRIWVSRVDNEEIWPDDEEPDSTNVLRAAYFDVGNLLGTADKVTGLGAFEQNKLAVFTSDKTFIYNIDPSIDLWKLDDRSNVNVGCVSHNTICQASSDLIFCSRTGVYAIRRSTENGIMISQVPMSDRIQSLYRSLLRSVPNPSEINAVWDSDYFRYHIYFPQTGNISKRLSLSFSVEGEPQWSTGDFLGTRCADFLAGNLVVGTSGGTFTVQQPEVTSGVVPECSFTTPILWQGSLSSPKQAHSLILQASGSGRVLVEAFDEQDRPLKTLAFDIEDTQGDEHIPSRSLHRQYEQQLPIRYIGLQLRFTITSRVGGLLRIVGFAITTES